MRTIKFRAWDGNSQKMLYQDKDFDTLRFIGGWEALDTKGNNAVSVAGNYIDQHFNNESGVLMQFTGLLDRNRKDIYESDIIKVVEDYTHPDGRLIKAGNYNVSFMHGIFGLFRKEGWWCLADFSVTIFPDDGKIYSVEVLGNVMENPELLKS